MRNVTDVTSFKERVSHSDLLHRLFICAKMLMLKKCEVVR